MTLSTPKQTNRQTGRQTNNKRNNLLRPEILNGVELGDEPQIGLPSFAFVVLEKPKSPSVLEGDSHYDAARCEKGWNNKCCKGPVFTMTNV